MRKGDSAPYYIFAKLSDSEIFRSAISAIRLKTRCGADGHAIVPVVADLPLIRSEAEYRSNEEKYESEKSTRINYLPQGAL